MSNKDRWSALSMTERAALINTYVKGGVLDLKKMKEHYNSFSNGGRMLDGKSEENQTLSNEHNPIESFVGGADIPVVRYKKGGKLNKFATGGPAENKYNIYKDENSFASRDAHRRSLEEFVRNNPTIKGLNTADFIDFFNQLAALESTYNPTAGGGMSYSGYYGLKGGRNYDANTQHKMAYEHLAGLFNNSIVKEDVEKGIQLGYSPAQILAKYWNQGNRVTNFLHRGVDKEDGLGTKISEYGWNMTTDIDYSKYLKNGITDDYVLVKDARTLGKTLPLVRNDFIDYVNRDSSIINLNSKIRQDRTGNKNAIFDPQKLQQNDTIWLKPITAVKK